MLSLREKIGQLLMIGFDGPIASDETLRLVSENNIGSIILFSRNIESAEQTRILTGQLQAKAKESGQLLPLIIATDQENGTVSRVDSFMPALPGNMVLGAVNDTTVTYEVSKATADVLKALGINMNLAPVLDCNSNSENPVIGVRSFGENSKRVALHGGAFIEGHHSAGVMTNGKHFPGHGDTSLDSHEEIPVVSHSYDRLKKVELLPFISAIQQNITSLMISHVHYEAIDGNKITPASLSKKVISGLLRNTLNYKGLVLTDCLEMNAVSKTVGVNEGALLALKAGADLLIVSHTRSKQLSVINRIEKAVIQGELDESRIDQALARIYHAKQYFLTETEKVHTAFGEERWTAYKNLASSVYKQGVTIVRKDRPLPNAKRLNIHVIWMVENNRTIVEEKKKVRFSVDELIDNHFVHNFTEQNWPIDLTCINECVDKADAIVIVTDYQRVAKEDILMIEKLNLDKLFVIAIKSPYVLSDFSKVHNLIAVYEPVESAIKAGLNVVSGELTPTGELPISLAFPEKKGILKSTGSNRDTII